jgi:acid stress-induced BolA-like protein IbaG/YrbA
MEAQEIKEMIERGLPRRPWLRSATSPAAGDHFEALVVSESFEGKGLVERHQAVYGALGDAMKARIHALTLKVMTPNQYQNRR